MLRTSERSEVMKVAKGADSHRALRGRHDTSILHRGGSPQEIEHLRAMRTISYREPRAASCRKPKVSSTMVDDGRRCRIPARQTKN